MFWKKGVLFCDLNPTCYAISRQKGIWQRHIRDFVRPAAWAKEKRTDKLPNLVSSHSSTMIKRGPGIDPVLQENKAVNIDLACRRINGTVIRPGQVFSFWRTVGKTSARKGYREGRVIEQKRLVAGTGGGLCNLGNTIHWLVLHSPLDVVEFHSHSDALAPDGPKRIPFSSGTSVCYNYIDYRFQNNTDQDVQLLVWCEDGKLNGEIRSLREYPWQYQLVEEDHHFQKEGEKFYRNSRIYQQKLDRVDGRVLEQKLVLKNHSEVMYDYDLIPADQIRE